ncbi:MAG: right-handed parallel beta-helix repeat-containing protein [Ignavibacteriaceae bacterium]|nr:right-handed parallel beta-helix repeat-containing protein [Ignavibacteriaceae bacterium]
MHSQIKVFLFIFLVYNFTSAGIYVSPNGDDTNSGSFDFPLKSIALAITKVQPGDTIYLKGGIYNLSTKISISLNGSEEQKYHLFAYNEERPILDFSSMDVNSSNRGISLSGSYWYLKGFDIKGAGDNGMHISGSYNRIEFCAFYENKDTGLQLGNGASNNQIINCDSYFNADLTQGNADGFAPKLDVGTNNYFYGCRAWQNSDDGWDGYMRGNNDVNTTLENCWCFANGYLKDGSASSGNGNGYKMGGSDDKTLMHNFSLVNCLAFDNRVRGFDQNSNKGAMTIYNCSAYRNGTNYSISTELNAGKTAIIANCISVGSYGSLGSFVIQQTNSWQSPFIVTFGDFISLDTLGVKSSRKSDGSLPDIAFFHLAAGSDLIDAGTNIGLPFNGSAPDLGAFENGMPSKIISEKIMDDFRILQNYPNPFNPSTKFVYHLDFPQNVKLEIFNLLGEKLTELINEYQNAGDYEVDWSAEAENDQFLSAGIYIVRLSTNNHLSSIKISLIK